MQNNINFKKSFLFLRAYNFVEKSIEIHIH